MPWTCIHRHIFATVLETHSKLLANSKDGTKEAWNGQRGRRGGSQGQLPSCWHTHSNKGNNRTAILHLYLSSLIRPHHFHLLHPPSSRWATSAPTVSGEPSCRAAGSSEAAVSETRSGWGCPSASCDTLPMRLCPGRSTASGTLTATPTAPRPGSSLPSPLPRWGRQWCWNVSQGLYWWCSASFRCCSCRLWCSCTMGSSWTGWSCRSPARPS